MDPLELVAKWLREGRDDARLIVDLPWTVEVKEGVLEASYPRFPFKVRILRRGDVLTLFVDPGLVLYTLSMEEKLLSFKRLLALNSELALVRTSVAGEDERVLLVADLEVKALKKSVFNDLLNNLLSYVVTVYHRLGREGELDELYYRHIIGIIEGLMERGMTGDEVVDYLTVKIGLPRHVAEGVVKEIYRRRGEVGKSYA